MDVRDAQEILKHLLEINPFFKARNFWKAIEACTFQKPADTPRDSSTVEGGSQEIASNRTGRAIERAATEALARELGEKANGYWWQLGKHKDRWSLHFRINRYVRERMTSAPTQRECVTQALELLNNNQEDKADV